MSEAGFIIGQLGYHTGETANLNYWAFWTGELGEQQASDSFIAATSLSSWHGGRLARHLAGRLHGNIGFMELNIHSLRALFWIRPDLAGPVPRTWKPRSCWCLMRTRCRPRPAGSWRRSVRHRDSTTELKGGRLTGAPWEITGFLYEIGLLKRYSRTGWARRVQRVADMLTAPACRDSAPARQPSDVISELAATALRRAIGP